MKALAQPRDWTSRYGPLLALGLYLTVFGLVAWHFVESTRFHVAFNDFWGNIFMASHIDFGHLETLYNGFHPVGYPLVLRLVCPDDPLRFVFALNIGLGLLMFAGFGLATAPILGRWLSVFSVIALSLFPIVFQYTITPGADIGCVTFLTLGWLLLARMAWSGRWHRGLGFTAGCLLGLSALWRQYGLVMVIACLLVLLVVRRRDLRFLLALGAGLLLAYSPQIIVNLGTGRGVLKTGQNFNVYRNMYGINWWQIPRDIPESIPGLILSDLTQFAIAFSYSLSEVWFIVLPFFIGVLLIRDRRAWRLMLVGMVVVVLYLAVVAVAGSPRGSLPTIPILVFAVGLLVREGVPLIRPRVEGDEVNAGGWPPHRWRTAMVTGLLLTFPAALLPAWLRVNYGYVKMAEVEREQFEEVETLLVDEGVDRSLRVFADDFDLYFTRIKPWRPRHNGGWAKHITYGFATAHPDLDIWSTEAFLSDCADLGVTHVIFSSGAKRLGKHFGEIDAGRPHPAFEKIWESPRYRVFRIHPSGVSDPASDAASASVRSGN